MRKTYALFLIVVLLSVGAAMARAQQSKEEPRIGVLGAPEEPRFTEIVAGLKKGLSELGYPRKPRRFWKSRWRGRMKARRGS